MIPIQLSVFFMIIYVLESLTIIVQSSLIVAVLGREWLQVRRLMPVDMILISLGISHFCLQWTSMLNDFCFYFNFNYVLCNLTITWTFFNVLTFWLNSLLTVFYCIKVSSFTHPIVLWLRWRILRWLPWLLLGCLMITCVTIIPSAIGNYIQIQFLTMEHPPSNSTVIDRLQKFHQYLHQAHTVALVIPFILFLASTILLMASLTKQIEHHGTGHCNPSMKAHFTALRSLAILFIVFTSYFLTILITMIGTLFDKRCWLWVWEAFVYAFIFMHSTSLMLSSPTLKRILNGKC
ncbi:taste receptor type 2 member 16 [Macaca nemestrina]|uniref:taste receptor type 2 member 16 n=1 Tax=Macaca nemestrina TaxID=9545 RepID=UPI0039B8C313